MDTARRFVPIALLHKLIDGLSYSKMNVLHLHLTDEPACRLESTTFPELTANLGSAFYTQSDMASLIKYAQARGVRVIPEVDVPAHAWGLRPLKAKGLSYCSEEFGVIANTPDSLQVLKALMKEFASIFPDQVRG